MKALILKIRFNFIQVLFLVLPFFGFKRIDFSRASEPNTGTFLRETKLAQLWMTPR
jgi:hypothetical protein